MINKNLLINNINKISKKLLRRNFALNKVFILNKEHFRKKIQIETEKIQYKINYISKKISILKLNNKNINYLCNKVNTLNKKFMYMKLLLKSVLIEIKNYYLSIPNIPCNDVPSGFNKKKNIELYKWGKPKNFNFPILDHVHIGKKLKCINFTKAVKISGSRFAVMNGSIALLHRALYQFMLDIHINKHGYIEYYLPYLVKKKSLYGSGQLPKFENELFHTHSINENRNNKRYYLIPTSEVPLSNLLRDEIIKEEDLPIKMTSHTPCFRSEAGSYGKDTYGLMRMHQFDKVEIFQIVKPNNSIKALEEITNHAEKILQLLNLPYRKILLCTGDMSFTSCKTYDLEVWIPSQNIYREISSCSQIGDFQSRRMKIRYRTKSNNKIKFVHTLNGSALAVGRTLIAVIENYQLPCGHIKIPKVLQKYMHNINKI
ncbi:MAG: serine--tRNA ligase [Candidatus Makana argininalis]